MQMTLKHFWNILATVYFFCSTCADSIKQINDDGGVELVSVLLCQLIWTEEDEHLRCLHLN